MRTRTPVLLAVLLVLAGCGDDDGGAADGTEAQPAPDVTVFQEGDFDGIPLPPLADEAGERSEQDGVVVQSFFVRNRTPEDVLRFYEEQLDGEVVTSPEANGDAWRGTWLRDGRQLLVSAVPAPAAGDDEVVTQMSLELSPAG
jgi:hypothetical protein